MLVSVVIPNYNHSLYLIQRIESVLQQTYQNFEVIILDDYSGDNSTEIIKQYRNHPKVSQVSINESNSGSPFGQWHKGVSLAKGEWVWIAESDDWCEPTFLQTIMAGLKVNPKCVMGYCQSLCVVDENVIRFQSHHHKILDFYPGRTFIGEYMLSGNKIFNASMVVWKKELFQFLASPFTSYKFCGDWLFWIELMTHGDVMVSGKVLNYYRKHNKDVTGYAYHSGWGHKELIKLGKDLLNLRLIGKEEYQKFMGQRYYEFKSNERSIDPVEAKEIKALLLEDKSVRSFILKNQLVKFKRYLKNVLPK